MYELTEVFNIDRTFHIKYLCFNLTYINLRMWYGLKNFFFLDLLRFTALEILLNTKKGWCNTKFVRSHHVEIPVYVRSLTLTTACLDVWPLGNARFCTHGCAGSLMDNVSEFLTGELNTKSSWVCFTHVRANTLGKYMNPHLLPPEKERNS